MVRELSSAYFTQIKSVLDRMDMQAVERIADELSSAYENGQRVFVMGNGGSAAAAAHFACDINKGASMGLQKRFRVVCLSDSVPILTAYANDLSYDDVFVEQMKNFLAEGDTVIGISGSGRSKNVLKAVDYANMAGAVTIGITGFDGGELAKRARHSLVIGADDMQKCEDVHLIVMHLLMQILTLRTRAGVPA